MTIGVLANCFAVCLFVFGYGCLRLRTEHSTKILSILRNNGFGIWIFSIAHMWFFFNIYQLEEHDCETLKPIMFVIFSFAFIGCVLYWKDFLLVRGMAMLLILTIHRALEVGYMEAVAVRPYLSGGLYVLLLIALAMGINPYWARDILPHLFSHHRLLLKSIAGICLSYGGWLVVLSFC